MRRLFILLTIVLLSLSACNTAQEATEAPVIEVTPEVTEAPVAEATAEMTADAETVELAQSYDVPFANGGLSFNYPEGWVVSGDFPELGILISTSRELVSQPFDGVVTGDDVFIDIFFIPEASLEVASPEAVLQDLIDDVENPAGTVSEIETLSINGKDAAMITLHSDGESDGIQITIDSGDSYSLVLASVADGNIETYRATIEAIAGSIDYTRESSD